MRVKKNILDNERIKKIIILIIENNNYCQKIAKIMKLEPSGVLKYLKELKIKGFITSKFKNNVEQNNIKRYFLTKKGVRLILDYNNIMQLNFIIDEIKAKYKEGIKVEK